MPLHDGHRGKDESMDPGVEQLHFCHPSSMDTQSKPSDARVVGFPLTVREVSTTAFICARITVSFTLS